MEFELKKETTISDFQQNGLHVDRADVSDGPQQ